MSKIKYAHKHERRLDTDFAQSMLGRESPTDLIVPNQDIVEIGHLIDMQHIRKLDLSFNPISDLNGLDQLNQLRYFSAYCCKLDNLDFVDNINKLENLIVHQNNITEFSENMKCLIKLKELRADKNKIKSIQNLKGCTSLCVLDLSWNNLTSIDGISGLQSLQELRVNNNHITTLKPLVGLPSLIELQIVSNSLRSLDGLQNVPTLETVHAEHNMINSLVIPKTSSHVGEKINKGLNKNKNNSNSSLVFGGMPHLSEMYLTGNRISTLAGPDSLGHELEVLELANNALIDPLAIVGILKGFKMLSELRIAGNPCTDGSMATMAHDNMHLNIANGLAKECNMLRSVDDLVIVNGRVVTHNDDNSNKEKEKPQPFSTWETNDDGETSADESAPVTARSTLENDIEVKDDDEKSYETSDDEEDQVGVNGEQAGHFRNRGEAIPDPNEHQEGRNAPRLNLEYVLTKEEIAAMEGEFTDLIGTIRQRMEEAAHEYEAEPEAESMYEGEFSGGFNSEEAAANIRVAEAIRAEKEAEEEALELQRQEERKREALRQANMKQEEAKIVADRIKLILKSRVPVPQDATISNIAEKRAAAITGKGKSKSQARITDKNMRGLMRKYNKRDTNSRVSEVDAVNQLEQALPRSRGGSADAQSRRQALDDEIMKMEHEFSSNAVIDDNDDIDVMSVGTAASSTGSLSSTSKTRKIPGTSRSKKIKPRPLLDGPGPMGSGLSLHGSRTKRSHYGKSAPSKSMQISNSNTSVGVSEISSGFGGALSSTSKLPLAMDQSGGNNSSNDSNGPSSPLQRQEELLGVGNASGQGRYEDVDAVKRAQRLLSSNTQKMVDLSLAEGWTEEAALAGSPVMDRDLPMTNPKLSPQRPTNSSSSGSPKKYQIRDSNMPVSPIHTARNGSSDSLTEFDTNMDVDDAAIPDTADVINDSSGGKDEIDIASFQADVEARSLAMRQGAGTGFNAFTGVMSRVADPRFGNRSQGLSLTTSVTPNGTSNGPLSHSLPGSRSTTPNTDNEQYQKQVEIQAKLNRSDSMPGSTPNKVPLLALNNMSLEDTKENQRPGPPASAGVKAMNFISNSHGQQSLSSPNLRYPGMDDDLDDLMLSGRSTGDRPLSARLLGQGPRQRPPSGNSRFRIPQNAKALLATKNDTDELIADSLTALSTATVDTLDVQDVQVMDIHA